MSFAPQDKVGFITCPFCAAIGRQDVRLALQVNRKANQNLYIVCDGRADPEGRGCNTRIYVGAGPSDHFKGQAAAPAEPETKDDGDKLSTVQPETEPGSDAAGPAETGDAGDGNDRPFGFA